MISNAGVSLIKSEEGFRATPYWDGPTRAIGYGHNFKAGESWSSITESEATQLLLDDAADAESAILNCVRVSLTQPQMDALISLVFNWGAGNFCKSVLLKKLNAGDYLGAAARLREWPVTGHGSKTPIPALVRRRAREADLFLSGTNTTANVTTLSGRGLDFLDALLDADIDDNSDSGPSMAGLVILGAVIVAALILLSD